MKTILIINEQHSLLPEQKEILSNRFENWEVLPVPSTGWTAKDMQETALYLSCQEEVNAVFASPIPYLLKLACTMDNVAVHIFHNDNRDKKELPNGKVIFTVAQEGWQLL